MHSLSRAATLLCAVSALACSGDRSRDVLAPEQDLSPGASGPWVAGHGDVMQAGGARRTFSFSAREMPDGTVDGHYNNHNRAGGLVNLGDVDCLLVDGNSAVLSGPIRKHTLPQLEGSISVFRVEDNGEGANAPADRISQVQIYPADAGIDCNSALEFVMLPIIGGNVQVQP